MTTARRPEFPEYGSGGDHVGARRGRRAFRFGVAAVVVFTGGLWLSEQYLRYEETERLYLLALTREPESARVLLRQAIKIDAATVERPTAKYAAALAEREEDDRRITAYERAYELDPANAFLAMRFGCELFKLRDMRRARELFRAAYDHDPANALPLYLEAATLPFIEERNPHLEESFQLIQRANTSEMPIAFQRPLWFSTLPQRGEWYARWRRSVEHDTLYPIQVFVAHICQLVETALDGESTDVWSARLADIVDLGSRILHDSQPEVGAPQASVGLALQLRAVQLQRRVQENLGHNVADLADLEGRIEAALATVNRFEFAREESIAVQRTNLRIPLQLLSKSVLMLAVIYLAVYAASRLMKAGRRSWTLRHRLWAQTMIGAGCVALFMFLTLLSYDSLQRAPYPWAATLVTWLWFAVLSIVTVAGAFYPAFVLPLAHLAVRERKPSESDALRLLVEARRARRIAYVSLMRRFYGIFLGSTGITACLWVVGFRTLCGLYPWQVTLLTPGLADSEHEAVRTALQALGVG